MFSITPIYTSVSLLKVAWTPALYIMLFAGNLHPWGTGLCVGNCKHFLHQAPFYIECACSGQS